MIKCIVFKFYHCYFIFMLHQKRLGSSVTYDVSLWSSISPTDPLTWKNLFGKPVEMYAGGMRLLSISDKSELELKDENGEPFVMFFKRGSMVAYGDGFLYYKDEDVTSLNPNI